MKFRILSLIFLLPLAWAVHAQDLGITEFSAPEGGCNLSSNETVSIKIFNYGSKVDVPFNLSYRVNGGSYNTETLTDTLLPNTSSTYTFLTLVDLSVAGDYVFDVYLSYPADLNRENDTIYGYTIRVDAPSAAGIVSGDATVCSGNNEGDMTLGTHSGTVIAWELSTDGGKAWLQISNTNTVQSYKNLINTTMYRAVVQNGTCPADYSFAGRVTINEIPEGGIVLGEKEVCAKNNSGTLTLTNYVGDINDWQYSTNSGATWNSTGIAAESISFSKLIQTRYYRAMVESGVCPLDSSNLATITVNPIPIASLSSTTVCEGESTTFTNASFISKGQIVSYKWDFGDNSTSSNLHPTHVYAASGDYKVSLIISSAAGCIDTSSYTAKVNALPPTTITADASTEFCQGSTVTLNGPSGYRHLWNNGVTYSPTIASTTWDYVLTVTNLITGCENTSSPFSVKVNPLPIANAGMDDTINLGKSTTLNASGGTQYTWLNPEGLDNQSSPTPVASPTVTTTYTVAVGSNEGCWASDEVTVVVERGFDIAAVNLFTPNGDGKNDYFYIDNIENYPDCEVTIMNRYGNLVYRNKNYTNNWDGDNLPDGTYYYVIKCYGQEEPALQGALTILRGGKK